MELARILTELWSRRRWLAVGAAVAFLAALSSVASVSLFPPSIKGKAIVFATASTQMIVDTPQSSLGDLSSDLAPLTARAGIFARFMTSYEALNYIGAEAGIPGRAIEAQGPFEIGMPTSVHTAAGSGGSSQAKYRLRFDQNPELPIVNIFARAPNTEQAIRLANGAVRGLSKYLATLVEQERIAPNRRVNIRQLGNATGGVVNPGANKKVGALVFVVVLLLWCGLMLFVARVRGAMLPPEAKAKAEAQAEAAPMEVPPDVPVPVANGDSIILPHVLDRRG